MGALAPDRICEGRERGGMNKQTDPELLRRLLLGDIKVLLRHRYGPTLPDDDAGREDLLELLLQVSLRANSPAKVMRNTIQVWAPWMAEAEANELIQKIERTPPKLRYRTPADLGQRFNVTNAERERLRLWMIAPVDVTQAEIAEWRRIKRRKADRLRKERKRREAGVRSRQAYLASSLSRQKPWVAEGISRAAWYRRRKAETGASTGARETETSVSANKLCEGSGQTCLTEAAAPPLGLPVGSRPQARAHNEDCATDTGLAA